MYALSLGVQNISDTLPRPVYALLSGLNASTVGIVALAAVQLSEKAIRDRLSRILVIFGACAGLCYSALWYFPVLILSGGFVTAVWDGWAQRVIRTMKSSWRGRRNRHAEAGELDEATVTASIPLEENTNDRGQTMRPRRTPPETPPDAGLLPANGGNSDKSTYHVVRVWAGLVITIGFFGMFPEEYPRSRLTSTASFIGVLVARAQLTTPPLVLDLFANMYLAGTVIFGGGPVVIPLLRTYVVDPGWVSGRDFLIGLAIIQAFPGPNFNFAVFLGALTLQNSRWPTIFGAFLAALGIFFPGITLAVAVQSFWRVLRKRKYVINFLRGVNATAVGLVFTAVYRLWEIGYLTPGNNDGQSLANEPWWVVIAAVTYAESAWFNVPPAIAIILGAILGLCWYGAVGM